MITVLAPETRPRVRSPFGSLLPALAIGAGYGVAAVTWVIAGDVLPGGRWLAVHLFTLGVLTNLVLAFAEHFGRTLTRTPGTPPRWQVPVVNVGIVATVVGLPSNQRWLTGTGATIVMAVVLVSYWRLRQMRRNAVGARFAWIVRIHERAHGAFVHGGILGLLMGIGAVTGAWYGSARLAHLHVNLLGWGGLTLLATLVFFGPTMARTRIIEGADDRAARALRRGATGLTVGVLALLATGVGGGAGTVARLLAAFGLAAFAWSVVVTCWPVAVAARSGVATAARWPVLFLCGWFVVVACADVAVVASAEWRYLDALGLALILGTLAQAMLATITHVAPMLRPEPNRRGAMRESLERSAVARTVLWNAGVAVVVLGAAMRGSAVVARSGWIAVLLALAWTVAAAAGRQHDDPQLPAPAHDRTGS